MPGHTSHRLVDTFTFFWLVSYMQAVLVLRQKQSENCSNYRSTIYDPCKILDNRINSEIYGFLFSILELNIESVNHLDLWIS